MTEKQNPVPQGKYVPATRYNNLIFTAGMTPRKNGVLLYAGKVKKDDDIEFYRELVYQASENALTAAQNLLAGEEAIEKVLMLTVYINAESDFSRHPKIADLATDYFVNALGDAGVAARAAVGMASLPSDAPVEISIICAAK